MRTSSSPIRSPSKLAVQKRVDEQSDDSDAESSRLTYSPLSSAPTSPRSKSSEPPPPYYSPTYSAVASRDSTKYSSLMQYLDGELDESMQLQRGEEAFDDMSSMSLSPSKDKRHKFSSSSSKANVTQTFLSSSHRNSPSKSVKSSGRSYVWDDWQNDDKQNTHNTESYGIDDEETNGDNTTYFSFAASRGGGTSSQKSHDGVSMGSKSIQHVVNEIKVKVDTMKGELENKHVRIRELQSELIRLNTAKNRRAQKFKSVWEAKLTAQREEQSAALKKTMDFVERIGHDVKQLNLKRDGLKEKHSRLSAHRETAIQILQDEMQRKVQRARRQWEVEEKAVFDKVLKGKEESLKKAAAESFGPALDKMVIDGKEAVRARTDECNKKLDRIKRELAAEVHEKIHQTRESLKNQMKMDDEKSRRVGERKLDDVLRKQSEELEAIKLKFARNRKLAEENAERTRRIDAETSLEALREVRKAESQQVLDLMASQQRELDQLVRNHADRIVSLKDGLNKREAEYCDKLTKELDAANSIHINRAKSSLTARYNAETEKVVAKLREEISGERKTVRDRIEAELDELRISAQNRLDAMQVSENRSVQTFKRSIYPEQNPLTFSPLCRIALDLIFTEQLSALLVCVVRSNLIGESYLTSRKSNLTRLSNSVVFVSKCLPCVWS